MSLWQYYYTQFDITHYFSSNLGYTGKSGAQTKFGLPTVPGQWSLSSNLQYTYCCLVLFIMYSTNSSCEGHPLSFRTDNFPKLLVLRPGSNSGKGRTLFTLKVLVTTIDALGHF